MIGNKTSGMVKKPFNFLLQKYQKGLEESVKESEFIFDNVDLLYYKYPKWLKDKKATINPKNKDDKCFKHAVAIALNHEQIKSHPERISKIKPFIDQYNWKKINFPSHKENWKKFEQNNKSIALNILYVPHNTEEIRPEYKSKYSIKCKFQVNLLMITDGNKWHYLAITKLSVLLGGITSRIMETFIV